MKIQNQKADIFRLEIMDIKWAAAIFISSALSALIIGICTYTLALIFAEPEPVSQAIMKGASAATSKVVVTSGYINPMLSIFIFNSIAALSAVIGAGLFMAIHYVLIEDIAMRPQHPLYARFSAGFEKMLMPVFQLMTKISIRTDSYFSSVKGSVHDKENNKDNTIWHYCGYGKTEYRMFSCILPYTVPLLTMAANGFLMGILLAYLIFEGALTGYQIAGMQGIFIGLIYDVVYFFISIIPHGIIEIPAILLAASLGHRLAVVQAHAVIEKNLFSGDDINSLKKDSKYVFYLTRKYLLSAYVWKITASVLLILLIASYIETYITPGIVGNVMYLLDNYLTIA